MNGLIKIIALGCLILGWHLNAHAQKLTVGEEVSIRHESPHPYVGSTQEMVTWQQEVTYTEKQAAYVALHFERLSLAQGDRLIVRSPDGSRSWEYDYRSNERGAFWSIPIYGNKVVIEIYSTNVNGGYGYIIDRIARGFSKEEMTDQGGRGDESICGSDDTQEAKCYQTSEPIVYDKSRAVARLWLNGTVNCTGWLIGDEGHLMTCWHCIENTNQANNTTVEMMAEGASCSTNCQTPGGCGGDIVANSVALVKAGNTNLDYSLVLLPTNVTSQYGFLQVRETGAVIGERIYIPQHPAGSGKRIALTSDALPDTDGFPHVVNGNSSVRIGHHADTKSGSSGSPVISYDDHLVVAVHEQGGCPNGGPNIINVLADLDYIPNNAIFINYNPCEEPYTITHITTNTLYDTDMNMPGDIFVHSGAELLIEAKIGMRQGTRILVERNARLVIDNGGVVTKGCDAPDWSGIQVLGNNQKIQPEHNATLSDADQAGIVWIDNGTVEWARTGVTAGGGYGTEFWGGLVWTNNATFFNNRKDVEFMSYKFTTNKSRFFNTTFSESPLGDPFVNTEGVTIWETDDIEFHGCTFSNKDITGIRTYDAGVRILDGCNFFINETGVSSYATYPMANKIYIGSGTGTENFFFNNKYHVNASLATGLFSQYSTGRFSLDVINNFFYGGDYGVIVDGPSNFRVAGNSFGLIPIGNWAANTGFNNIFNQNLIGCNSYDQSSNISILAIGENKQMQFLGNDFVGALAGARDFVLANSFFPGNNGAIMAMQGNPFVPAGNCFSDPGVEVDIQTWGITDYFTYYFESGEPSANCDPEPLNLGNYGKVGNGDGIFIVDCAKFGGLPSGEQDPKSEDLDVKRLQLQALIPSILTNANAQVQYYQVLAEKEAILKHLVSGALKEKDFATAETLLAGEGGKAAQWAIFGLRMDRQDYIGAAQLLGQMPVVDVIDAQFRDIQLINLQRLQNPMGFELSATQEAYLNSVADGYSPIRGYARGILGLLKDRVYFPDEYDIAEERNRQIEHFATETLKVYPVPASDQLVVVWPTLPERADAQLQVFDLLGRSYLNASLGTKETTRTLHVANLPEGVYFLIVSDKGKVVHRAKFTVQH